MVEPGLVDGLTEAEIAAVAGRLRPIAKNCANFHPFHSQQPGFRSRGWCQACGVPWQEFEVGELHRCTRFVPTTPNDSPLSPVMKGERRERADGDR